MDTKVIQQKVLESLIEENERKSKEAEQKHKEKKRAQAKKKEKERTKRQIQKNNKKQEKKIQCARGLVDRYIKAKLPYIDMEKISQIPEEEKSRLLKSAKRYQLAIVGGFATLIFGVLPTASTAICLGTITLINAILSAHLAFQSMVQFIVSTGAVIASLGLAGVFSITMIMTIIFFIAGTVKIWQESKFYLTGK